jgi:hypothetical protein
MMFNIFRSEIPFVEISSLAYLSATDDSSLKLRTKLICLVVLKSLKWSVALSQILVPLLG